MCLLTQKLQKKKLVNLEPPRPMAARLTSASPVILKLQQGFHPRSVSQNYMYIKMNLKFGSVFQ